MREKLKLLSFLILATVIGLALVEGGVGLLMFAARAVRTGAVEMRYYAADEARRHTRYDPELGWVGMPNRNVPDLYGPGNDLATERHGFRNARDVEPAEPAGMRRVVCSGDSFTFGQGVANDETWCHLLGELDPTVDPVNMGQRGYGIDQAYLWYVRDGAELEHRLHVLAFIGGDFARMQRAAHHGYAKPVLSLEDGRLVTHNVPVPRFRTWRPWMSRIGRAATELHVVRAAERVMGRSGGGAARSADDASTREVARALFRDLDRIDTAKGSRLILVWLPVESEIDREEVHWRRWLADTAAEDGLTFYDLGDDLRAEDPVAARGFFIGKADPGFEDAEGHYNERGHAWVAERLTRRLAAESWWR